MDHDGQEALRAIHRGKRTCVKDLLLLEGIYISCIIPAALWFTWVFGLWQWEILRILLEITITIGVFYLLSILIHSVALGGMAVLFHLFFCAASATSPRMQFLCPLQAEVPLSESRFLFVCIPALVLAVFCFCGGYFVERYSSKI